MKKKILSNIVHRSVTSSYIFIALHKTSGGDTFPQYVPDSCFTFLKSMSDDLVGSLPNCAISYNVKQNVNQSNLDEQRSVTETDLEIILVKGFLFFSIIALLVPYTISSCVLIQTRCCYTTNYLKLYFNYPSLKHVKK